MSEILPCRKYDPELFFTTDPVVAAFAQSLCREQCPIQVECFVGASDRGEQAGIWGGYVFHEGKILERIPTRGRPAKHRRTVKRPASEALARNNAKTRRAAELDREEIRRLDGLGKSRTEIANMTGFSLTKIRHCLGARYEAKRRVTAAQVEEMQRLRGDGWSYSAIAENLMLGHNTVKAYLNGERVVKVEVAA